MRILIACEFSGIVRDAFIERGHDAVSCDLLPSESPGPHIQADVTHFLTLRWDMVIAHPPCTYLANSGVRWLYGPNGDERYRLMQDAARFFRSCLNANAEKVVVENPVIHKHSGLPKPTMTTQPWEHGHGEIKRICLWLKGLPRLKPSNIVSGRTPRVHHMSPSVNRSKERSRFFPGVAKAMAKQWG